MYEPGFASEDAFDRFCLAVKTGNRHVLDAEVLAFVNRLAQSVVDRELILPADSVLFRSQLGCRFEMMGEIPRRL